MSDQQITCATCQICQEPPAVDGIDVIIQAVPLSDTKVSIWYKSAVQIAGAQYQNVCTGRRAIQARRRRTRNAKLKHRNMECLCVCVCTDGSGASQFVDVVTDGSGGGQSANVGMDVTGGVEGKWLIFSLSGGSLDPGFYHFTTLLVEPLSATGCVEDSFRLTAGVNSDPSVGRQEEEEEDDDDDDDDECCGKNCVVVVVVVE